MAIAFNAAADLGNNGGTSNNLSASYTVGSGANRLLVVAVMGDIPSAGGGTGYDDVSVTYAGQALTLAAKNLCAGAAYPAADRFIYLFFLPNPTAGANTVAVSATNAHYLAALAADYSGVAQGGQPDATATAIVAIAANTGATLTTDITTVAANDWLIVLSGNTAAHPDISYTSDDLTERIFGNAYGEPYLFDSNGPLAAGVTATDVTTSNVGAYALDNIAIVAAFAPATQTPLALAATGRAMSRAAPHGAFGIPALVGRARAAASAHAAASFESLAAMTGLALGMAGAEPGGTAALFGLSAARGQGRGFLASGALVLLRALALARSAAGFGPGAYGASMAARADAAGAGRSGIAGAAAIAARGSGQTAGRSPPRFGIASLPARAGAALAGRAGAAFPANLSGLAGRAQGGSGATGGMSLLARLAARGSAANRAMGFLGTGLLLPLLALGRGVSAMRGFAVAAAILGVRGQGRGTAAAQPQGIARLQGTIAEQMRALDDPQFRAQLAARNTLTLTVSVSSQFTTSLAAASRMGMAARMAAAFRAGLTGRGIARGTGAPPLSGAASIAARGGQRSSVAVSPQFPAQLAATGRIGAVGRAVAAYRTELQAQAASRSAARAGARLPVGLAGRGAFGSALAGTFASFVPMAATARGLFMATARGFLNVGTPNAVNPSLEIVSQDTPPMIESDPAGPQKG